jgi:hypothetical protein
MQRLIRLVSYLMYDPKMKPVSSNIAFADFITTTCNSKLFPDIPYSDGYNCKTFVIRQNLVVTYAI